MTRIDMDNGSSNLAAAPHFIPCDAEFHRSTSFPGELDLRVGTYYVDAQDMTTLLSMKRSDLQLAFDKEPALNVALNRILASDPDIVAVQNVRNQWKSLTKKLNSDVYKFIILNQLCIIYNCQRVEEVKNSNGSSWFNPTPARLNTEPGYASALPHEKQALFSRFKSACSVQMQHFQRKHDSTELKSAGNSASPQFILVNCNWELPIGVECDCLAKAMVRELLNGMSFYCKKLDPTPRIIFAGNFGFSPSSPAYHYMTRLSLQVEEVFRVIPEDLVEIQVESWRNKTAADVHNSNDSTVHAECAATLRVRDCGIGQFHHLCRVDVCLPCTGEATAGIADFSVYQRVGVEWKLVVGPTNGTRATNDADGTQWGRLECNPPVKLIGPTRCFQLRWTERRSTRCFSTPLLFSQNLVASKDSPLLVRLVGLSYGFNEEVIPSSDTAPIRSAYAGYCRPGSIDNTVQIREDEPAFKELCKYSAVDLVVQDIKEVENSALPWKPIQKKVTTTPFCEWIVNSDLSPMRIHSSGEPQFTYCVPQVLKKDSIDVKPPISTRDYIFFHSDAIRAVEVAELPTLERIGSSGMPSTRVNEPMSHCYLMANLRIA